MAVSRLSGADSLAVALTDSIRAGDVEAVKRLRDEHPDLASARSRDQLAAAIRAENFADIDIPASTAPLHTFAAFQRPVSPVTTYQHPGIRDPYPEAERIARG